MSTATFDESDLSGADVLVYTPARLELGATLCTAISRSALGVRVQWPDRSAGAPWAKPGPRRTFDLSTGLEARPGAGRAPLSLTAASLARVQAWLAG